MARVTRGSTKKLEEAGAGVRPAGTKPPVPLRKRLPDPSKGDVMNPTESENWKNVEPRTKEEMDEWMERARGLILRYLKYRKEEAEDPELKAQKDAIDKSLAAEWARWEPETDLQTGEIFDPDRREAMFQSMASIKRAKKSKEDANKGSRNYMHAQTYWEDYLYYQNAWNRPRSNDFNNVRGPRGPGKQNMSASARKQVEEEECDYTLWRRNMIRLYNKWGIGDRSRLPDGGIGPDQLHMYPDNIRHSTNGDDRRRCLQEQFPTSDIRLNHEAIAKRSKEVERTRKKKGRSQKETVDQSMYAAMEKLPKNHELYHATTEHSTPWQYQGRRIHTSWESSSWGPAIASKTRICGNEHESKRPYYATSIRPRRVVEKNTLFDANNERRRDNENGGWLQGTVEHVVQDEFYELDEDEQRIPIPGPPTYDKPTYVPAGTVKEVSGSNGKYTARREAYPKFALEKARARGSGDELSDAEDGEYEEDDVPLPERAGGDSEEEDSSSGSSGDGDSDGSADGGSDGSSAEDSDDDGDLFRSTYLGLPIRKRPTASKKKRATEGSVSSGLSNSPDGLFEDEHSSRPGGKDSDDDDKGKDRNDKDQDSGDEDEDSSNDDPPGPSGGRTGRRVKMRSSSKHRKITKAGSKTTAEALGRRLIGEKFKKSAKGKKGTRCIEYTHKFSEDFEWTQVDEVPDFKPDASEETDSTGNFIDEVYPDRDKAKIPAPRHNKYKNKKWVLGKDGIFRKDDLHFQPAMVLRRFRKGSGRYVGSTPYPYRDFEQLMTDDITEKRRADYNRWLTQYTGRGDSRVKNATERRDRWTAGEIEAVVRYLNQYVDRHGLVYLVDHWRDVLREVQTVVNDYRRNHMRLDARGDEAMRTKFSRAAGLQGKVEKAKALKGRGAAVAETDLKPKNYFTVGDFGGTKDVKTLKTDKVAKSGKRTAGGRTKTRTSTEEDGDEDIDEDGDQTDEEGSGGDYSEGSSRPPKKKRKH